MGRSTYEDELTFVVAEYLDLKGWLYTHFPAGEYRPVRTGAKLKRMGLKRGVPDMLIFERWAEYDRKDERFILLDEVPHGFGVVIELKSPKGRPTKEQTGWLAALKKRGWSVHVCRTIDEVVEATNSIRGGKR
jgi:hypothetical protein